jgi:hypothetical protein
MTVNKEKNMKPSLAVRINYLVGTMMIEFVKRLGPLDEDRNTKVTDAYFHMNLLRKEISDTLIDHLDAEEESTV